ncbi:MAG TPA: cysteine desulfurase family protein, partial [Longimicrobiales bacterium]|nr:cysteine desulfurase family protein [Longimicrobiales bacterium]
MEPVYLDHAATTPVRPEVRAAMDANLDDAFGNPSSAHRWGRKAAAALDRARARAAEALGARPSEILFVRGGTESDNLAVRGRWAAIRRREPHPLVVHTALEHPAVRETATALEAEGARREVLPVDRSGAPDLELLGRILSRSPAVVSMMWVNNEVGTVLPVPEAARLCAGAGVALHTDAVQAVGKIRVRVDEVPLALLTATGHKIGGPRGTGILFVREGTELVPLLLGGGQERGLRPGTQDVAGAVGMAEALALAVAEQEDEARRLGALRDHLEGALLARLPGLRVHGVGGVRAPHVLNLGVPGADPAALVQALDLEGIAASSGSACSSGANRAG